MHMSLPQQQQVQQQQIQQQPIQQHSQGILVPLQAPTIKQEGEPSPQGTNSTSPCRWTVVEADGLLSPVKYALGPFLPFILNISLTVYFGGMTFHLW